MVERQDFPRLWKKIEIDDSVRNRLIKHAEDILKSDKYHKTCDFIQHGDVSVYEHCLMVAACALHINDTFKFNCNERALVRGALLHDYFLYDWHDHDCIDNIHPKLHGFYHPGIALKNASRDFNLSPIEKDIIKKHMWPLTVIPPSCREAWVVTMADKYSSLLETVKIRKGHGKTKPKYA
ncbi:MAG: HD domain-containing protein [Butyrivibrio sp.]|nr:HD domain-containing protein [Butyrivibrio sp.]